MSQSPFLLQEYAYAVIADRLREAAHADLCRQARAPRPGPALITPGSKARPWS